MITRNTTKGYTLLFAVIVSTIVLAVAAFVVTASRKQFILASAARDSTVAIYAADSGIECAVEANGNGLLSLTLGNNFALACNNQNPSTAVVNSGAGYSIPVVLPASVGYSGNPSQTVPPLVVQIGGNCALITITDGLANDGSHLTVIDSKGYNVPCVGPVPKPGPRNEERAIRMTIHS